MDQTLEITLHTIKSEKAMAYFVSASITKNTPVYGLGVVGTPDKQYSLRVILHSLEYSCKSLDSRAFLRTQMNDAP